MALFNTETVEILIFKTNIKTKKDIKKAAKIFKDNPRVKNWNIDTEDIDKILRLEVTDIMLEDIVQQIRDAGFSCNELED